MTGLWPKGAPAVKRACAPGQGNRMNGMSFVPKAKEKNTLASAFPQNQLPAYLPTVSAAFAGMRKEDSLTDANEYPTIEAFIRSPCGTSRARLTEARARPTFAATKSRSRQ